MSSNRTVRSAIYLYLETLLGLVMGYVFWLIVSNMTAPTVIGKAAATVSFALIISAIASLGIPVGVQRLLGKALADNDRISFKRFTQVAIILVGISTLGSVAILGVLNEYLRTMLNLTWELFLFVLVIVTGACLVQIFRAVMISSLRTRLLVLTESVSEVARLSFGIFLVMLGFDTLGILIGYSVAHLLPLLPLTFFTLRLIRLKSNEPLKFNDASRQIIKSSTASWIPNMVTQIGTNIGILVIFGSQGALATGLYYIAFAIFSAVFAIPYSITNIAYPIMSGMTDGRKRFAFRSIKLGMAVSVPGAIAIMVYSEAFLGIFGKDFQSGTTMLMILLASLIPTTIGNGISFLAYSYGKYRYVLAYGLVGSLSRIVLYFVLVPSAGGTGAAQAFLIGSLTSLVIAIFIAHKIEMKMRWTELLLVVAIPSILGSLLTSIGINFVLGSSLILLASGLLYLRLRVITDQDLHDILFNALPRDTAESVYGKTQWLMRKMLNEVTHNNNS